jgi:hypothetical protein
MSEFETKVLADLAEIKAVLKPNTDTQTEPPFFGIYDFDSDVTSKTAGTVRLPYREKLAQADLDLIASVNERVDRVAAAAGVPNVIYPIGDRFVIRCALEAFNVDPKSALGALIIQNTEIAGSQTIGIERGAFQGTSPPLRYEMQPKVTAIGKLEDPRRVVDELLARLRREGEPA